jgi:CRP-like cAMP-binding protein
MPDAARLQLVVSNSLVSPQPVPPPEGAPVPASAPTYSIAETKSAFALCITPPPVTATVLAPIHGKELVRYARDSVVLHAGEPSEFLYYLESGRIKLSVYSRGGREATVAVLGPGQFLGEACLFAEATNTASAVCLTHCRLWRLQKSAVHCALHISGAFANAFVQELLTRNRRYEADLADHLLNRCEQRLARALLMMAHFGEHDRLKFLPHVSHQTLADLVGTTRARITHFMNAFRERGFINYDRHHIGVHDSLRTVLREDDDPALSVSGETSSAPLPPASLRSARG